MKLRSCVVLAALFAVMVLGLATAQATTWNAGGDMYTDIQTTQALHNPTGDWTYGYSDTVGSTFTAYPYMTNFDDQSNLWRCPGWNATGLYGGSVPGVWVAMDNLPAGLIGDEAVAAQSMFLHPGNDATCSIVQWTAPAAGYYSVSAIWNNVNTFDPAAVGSETAYNAGVDVHTYLNGVSIYDGVTSKYDATGAATMSAQTLSLAAGDKLDFIVSPLGASGTIDGLYPLAFDITTFNATISTVPEPSTLALFGSALIGLLVYAWRRK